MNKARFEHQIKCALLGGSFNPIHIGHLHLAEVVVQTLSLETLFFVPAYISPLKPTITQVSPSQRLEMLQLALDRNSKLSLLDWELNQPGLSYTILTVEKALEQFNLLPKELGIIIGMDNLKDLENWHRFPDLCQLVTWIIADRPETGPLQIPSTWIQELDFAWEKVNNPQLQISSSYIRQQIATDGPYQYLLPQRVYDYILSHQIYRN